MSQIGKRNILPALRHTVQGLYLDGGELGEILLPRRYSPENAKPGDPFDVFIYRDSEDRLVASTETPYAMVGEFAYLKVLSVNARVGAFLDWGLTKDLLLPIRQQTIRFHPGNWVIVYIYLDDRSERIVASAKIDKFFSKTPPTYQVGEMVELLVIDRSPLGFNVVVNHTHRGLVYHADMSGPLPIGSKMPGYVRSVRPDGKIDIGLDPVGYTRVSPLKDQIIEALKANHGQLPYDDHTTPEIIREKFNTSKNAFKLALGALYRERRIDFTAPGIRLVAGDSR